MSINDRKRFADAMRQSASIFEKEVNEEMIRIYFNALSVHSIESVEDAFNRWISTGGKFPLPANILKIITESSEVIIPTANEAWAIVHDYLDDVDSVKTHIIPDGFIEMAGCVESFFKCEPQQKTQAASAFKDCYEKWRKNAIESGLKLRFRVIAGSDKILKQDALKKAIECNFISFDYAVSSFGYLPDISTTALALNGLSQLKEAAAKTVFLSNETKNKLIQVTDNLAVKNDV